MKKLRAQQITEFLIATPLLLIFFVVLTEFAFALNAHLTFVNATKNSIPFYYSAFVADNDPKIVIKDAIKISIDAANLPNSDTLNVEVILVDGIPAIISSYSYKPDFSFVFLPAVGEMHFSSVALLPGKAAEVSGYSTGLNQADLDSIYNVSNPESGGG